MLDVALIGCGRIGQVHAPNVAAHPGSRLVAVADAHAPAAEALGERFGVAARSADAIMADEEIGAVLIASSTHTHCDLIEAAARAGKAVLCEKPVDLDLARARACQKAVAGRPVMIGFNRRFDATFAALRQAVAGGEIGRAEMLAITSHDPAPPPLDYVRVSGGLFRDMTIHDFDMSRFLLGATPETVFAVGAALVDPAIGEVPIDGAGDVDSAVVTMTYADGRIATIRNSRRAAYGYDQRVEVLGERGMVEARNVAENQLVRSTAGGVTAAKPLHFFLERYREAYAAEWDAFVTALADGTPVPVTLEDGVAALAMAEAATRSLREGRPVRLADV